MKEATSEVSGTVITIVILAAVLGIGVAIFSTKDANGKSVAQKWIENIFDKQIVGDYETNKID